MINFMNLKIVLNFLIASFFLLFNFVCFSSDHQEGSKHIDDYKIITDIDPPYYINANKREGLSIEILALVMKDMGSKLKDNKIEVKNWAEAVHKVKKNHNYMLLSMFKTLERTTNFKLVGPVAPLTIALSTFKDSDIKINSLNELDNYKIGIVRNDISEELLLNKKIKKRNISAVYDLNENTKKISTNRIDIIASDIASLYWIEKNDPQKKLAFKTIFVLEEGDLFFAFNKHTPDSLINSMQESLEKVKLTEAYRNIINKYLD